MLVFADGSQAGTLGGGCVEAEVKRRALAIADDSGATIAKFVLDNDYGWDDGLICGGRMQVLVDPVTSNESVAYFQRLQELIDDGTPGTEVIVFDSEASRLPEASRVLLDKSETVVATLVPEETKATLTEKVHSQLKPIAERPNAYAVDGLSYLPLLERCRLLIVGGGHIGQAVADLAADLQFDVWVLDDRADVVSERRFPRAQRRISGAISEVLIDLEVTANTYCLIVTRGHAHDEEALFHLADRGAAYVGMIGSRRKIRLIYDDLLAEGISAESLAKVYAPLGVDIGSQTVHEIAISIAAELIAHRNLAGNVPGRPKSINIAESV